MNKIYIKHAGTWKEPTKIYVKHAGTWKEATSAWVKDAGTWKQFYPTSVPITPITDIMLSANTAIEDAALGTVIGTLSTAGGTSVAFSIQSDASGKFGISGSNLIVIGVLDYETATSHNITVRATNADATTFDEPFSITVTDVIETPSPSPLPPGDIESDPGLPPPTIVNVDGGIKFQGNKPAGGSGKFVYNIGTPQPGMIYTIQYDPDFTLLSNQGKSAFVGFGFKNGNNFHFTGLKGNGTTGLLRAKITGTNFNATTGHTTTTGASANYGTQAGPNWLQLQISADGTQYDLRTSPDGVSWTNEYINQSMSPGSGTAGMLGVAVFLESTDSGPFTVKISLWQQSDTTNVLDLDFLTTTTLDSRITFSRNSPAPYFGTDGFYHYLPHNSINYSEDFTNSTWTKSNGATITANAINSPIGTLTADKLNHVTAGTVPGGRVFNSANTNGVYPVIMSVYVKAGTKTWAAVGTTSSPGNYVWVNLATGVLATFNGGSNLSSAGIADAGNGWYRVWVVTKATGVDDLAVYVAEADNSFNCTSPGDIYVWGAQVERVTTETTPSAYMMTTLTEAQMPNFDWHPVTHQPRGLLVEKRHSNNVQRSDELDSSVTNATATTNALLALSNRVQATLLTSTGTTPCYMQHPGIVSGAPSRFSVFAKRGNNDWFYVQGWNSVDWHAGAWFNLATGQIGFVDKEADLYPTIEDYGNGWYRCAVTYMRSPRLGSTFQYMLSGMSDENGTTLISAGKTVYIFGAQCEYGWQIPSQYHPSYVGEQREADFLSMTGTNFSSWFNATAGTFFVEFDTSADTIFTTPGHPILALDNNGLNEQIRLFVKDNDVRFQLIDNGVVQSDLFLGKSTTGPVHRAAFSFAANDIKACYNGYPVVVDTSATLPTVDRLRIGGDFDSVTNDATNMFSGHFRKIKFFNQTKPSDALRSMTVPDVAVDVSISSISVPEQQRYVRTLTATGGGTIVWSIIGGADASRFTLDPLTGVLSFVAYPDYSAPIDADANNVYVLQVQATNGATSDTATFNVTVTDRTDVISLNFLTSSIDSRVLATRASQGMYWDVTGLLKHCAHNLVFPSEDFSVAAWTKGNGGTITADNAIAPDGTMTADRLNHVNSGSVAGGAATNTGYTVPLKSIMSVYAKAGTKNFLMLGTSTTASLGNFAFFNLAAGTVGAVGTTFVSGSAGIQSVGNGWYRCWAACVMANPAGVVLRVGETNNTLNCTSPGDIYIWGAQLEWVTNETTPKAYVKTTTAINGISRIDYDPVSHANRGLLIEDARTNSGTNSQDFSASSWVKTGVTVTADNTTAPDGTTTADLITVSASPASVQSNAINWATGAIFTASVFVKRGTSDWVYLIGRNTTPETPTAWFNINTGVIGTVQSPLQNVTIENVGNSWWRLSISRPGSASTSETFNIGPCDADGSTTVTVGRTVYLWGVQQEGGGGGATSYIPTPNAAIPRAADVVALSPTEFANFNNIEAGAVVASFQPNPNLQTPATRPVISFDNKTGGKYVRMFAGPHLKAMIADYSILQADIDLGPYANATTKMAMSFADDDVRCCVNGGDIFSDNDGHVPPLLQVRIGTDGTNTFHGWIKSIDLYSRPLSNLQMQTLTAGGTPLLKNVPSGSFTAWNPSDKNANAFVDTNGRRVKTAGGSSSAFKAIRSLSSKTSGKYHVEFRGNWEDDVDLTVGIGNASQSLSVQVGGSELNSIGFWSAGHIRFNATANAVNREILQFVWQAFEVDIDAKTFRVWNGRDWSTPFAAPTLNAGPYFIMASMDDVGVWCELNAGHLPWQIPPSSGYVGWDETTVKIITSESDFSVVQDTSAVTTLAAVGSGTITWSIIGGADAAKFTINATSGALSFVTAPDFEAPTDADTNNIYVVQVQATNGTTTDSKTLNVQVLVNSMCTFDPFDNTGGITLSNFNRKVTTDSGASGTPRGARGTLPRSTGKVHVEFRRVASPSSGTFGIITSRMLLGHEHPGNEDLFESIALWLPTGNVYRNAGVIGTASFGQIAANTWYAMEVDFDEKLVRWGSSTAWGVWFSFGLMTGPFTLSYSDGSNARDLEINCGQSAFAITPNAGFGAWTAPAPAPTIQHRHMLSASRAGIISPVITEDHTGKTRIV